MEWHEFYARRVGESYINYFKEKYSLFLLAILSEAKKKSTYVWGTQYNPITELGCGIGTASICLYDIDKSFNITATDKSMRMLELARKNVKHLKEHNIRFYQYNIPNFIPSDNICFSHGVLEHFPPNVVKKYLAKLKSKGISSVHYVPTDKYTYKSFGDERLLSVDKWISTALPVDMMLYNNDKDLVLIC